MIWRSEMERSHKEAGFTLAETLVTLAILSLAIGLVAGFAPKQSIDRTLRADAVQVINAARTARLTALQSDRVVAFDPQAHTGATAQSCDEFDLPELVFYPNGTSTGGVFCLSRQDESLRIEVDWLTGLLAESRAP